MYAIVMYNAVDRSVELDSGDFRAREYLALVYIVNIVTVNFRENASEVADDSGLLAAVDPVISYGVATDGVFRPTALQSLKYRLELVIESCFSPIFDCKIMTRSALFSEAYSDAFGISDRIILDYPASAPIRTDQANLLRSWRCPLSCGVHKRESAHRDIIDTVR